MARAWIAVATLVIAGCLSPGPAASPAPSAAEDLGADVGSLSAVVVTPEQQPIAGAQVVLSGTERSGVTDDTGNVVFDSLAPAEYTVLAGKAGYRPLEARGRLVKVVAGETSSVQLRLEAVEAVEAGLSYASTKIFRGFISCSASVGGQATNACSRGGALGSVSGDNSSHPWQVDNHFIETVILEAEWQPTIAILGSQLHISLNGKYTCATSCSFDEVWAQKGGVSPLWVRFPEPDRGTATERMGKEPEKYPRTVYTALRAYCSTGCTHNIILQQGYNAYATAFYGEPAPADWSFLKRS